MHLFLSRHANAVTNQVVDIKYNQKRLGRGSIQITFEVLIQSISE